MSNQKRYEKLLAEKTAAGELKCPKCGNTERFMVNELGHVFCSKCHNKIPFVQLK